MAVICSVYIGNYTLLAIHCYKNQTVHGRGQYSSRMCHRIVSLIYSNSTSRNTGAPNYIQSQGTADVRSGVSGRLVMEARLESSAIVEYGSLGKRSWNSGTERGA